MKQRRLITQWFIYHKIERKKKWIKGMVPFIKWKGYGFFEKLSALKKKKNIFLLMRTGLFIHFPDRYLI